MTMRQAQARKSFDAYLAAPRHSAHAHLQVVEHADERTATVVEDLDTRAAAVRVVDDLDARIRAVDAQQGRRPRISDSRSAAPDAPRARRPRITAARTPAPDPAIEQPDWAEPFADARWDDRLGEPPLTDAGGRRTVVVTGRPGPQHRPQRDRNPGTTARRRRVGPTRARLAGRPDRVALWAVALGLIMAAMAGFTGGGHGHSSHAAGAGAPAPVFDR
jgi:hypothetical protein